MSDSSPSDTILGSPSNDQRCIKTDGRFWRCGFWKMPGKNLCQKHFLKQIEYQNKKKNMSPQQQNKPIERKTHLPNDDVDKNKKRTRKNKKSKKKEESEDDSIERLFGNDFPSEEGDEDDSIEKLFDDCHTSESDMDSCPLVTRRRKEVSTVHSVVKDESVDELRKNQDTFAGSTTGS